jgi:regulator of RNase E activity RraA
MRTPALFVLAAAFAASLPAQVFTLTRDQLIRFTASNPYDRFPDGRPKVPDEVLEKVRGLSLEEVFAVLPGKGFRNQYAGAGWQVMHPEKKLVGRAVTVQFMPARPDVSKPLDDDAKAKGVGDIPAHQRVIDMLQPGDVLVADLFGLIDGGTIVGDNLAMAIASATKTGGLVVDGGIRDLEGIFPIGMPVYYRGADPTFLNYQKVMVTGVNVPVRIGGATVMPGDVVLGDREGLYFIPPQHLKEILDKAEETHVHDEWTKGKFQTGKYKSSDLYGSPRIPELKKEYEEYKKQKLGR